jgi:hypothetical protein
MLTKYVAGMGGVQDARFVNGLADDPDLATT